MKTNLFKNGFLVVVLTMISSSNLLAFTAVTDGDWTDPATWGGVAPSGTVSNQDIIIPSGIEVNLNTDVTFSGLLNNFTVNGTLMSSTNNQLIVQLGTFSGSGDIDIQRIVFDGVLITYSHSGDLTVNTFINMGAAVVVTSQVTVSDSLDLDAGTFTLNTGGNLMIETDAVIVRDAGSLVTTGGVFNSGGSYYVRYEGGSKTTGIEINSTNLQNVDIDLDNNTSTLTMASNLQVHGDLNLSMGILTVGANDLELYGDIDIQTGAMLTTAATSNVRIETGTSLTSGLVFTSGSSVDQLTVDYTGSTGNVDLNSNLAIAGELQLHNGAFSIESGATLTMNAGSLVQVMEGELEGNGGTFDGTASYDVEYIGDTTVTAGLELTGTGLNDVLVNIGEGQVVMDDDVTVGGELELSGGKLNLNTNDLILNGTLNQDEDSPIIGDMNSDLQLNLTLVGNDTIYFDENYMDLEQLIVDVTGGDIVLGTGLHIHDELTLTSGSIVLTAEDLVIEDNADITGYSNTQYVVTTNYGMLQMQVVVSTPYVVFPVGTEDNYFPASLQQGSGGTSGHFTVRAFEGVYVGGTQSSGFNSAMIASVVNNTWIIEADGTSLDLNMKLGWELAAEVNGFDRTDAFISHFNGGWDFDAPSAAVSGANSTYEMTRTGITTLSPFTVADGDAELIVNEESASMDLNLYPNPVTDIMNIDYKNTNSDQYTYEVTDLTGRTYAVIENGNNQMDVSALSTGVYVLKMTNVETNAIAVKRFIKK